MCSLAVNVLGESTRTKKEYWGGLGIRSGILEKRVEFGIKEECSLRPDREEGTLTARRAVEIIEQMYSLLILSHSVEVTFVQIDTGVSLSNQLKSAKYQTYIEANFPRLQQKSKRIINRTIITVNVPYLYSVLVQLNRFKVRPTIRRHKTVSTASSSDLNTIADVFQKNIPIDPARVVWETSVVTKEVTLHLGRRKSVRTLTVTTTVPVTLAVKPSIASIGNEIYPSPAANNHLAATIPPFGDFDSFATPSLRVLTRTFSETEVSANTALVPVFDGESTTMHTVTESYYIRKMITAYRTMPPGEIYDETDSQNHHHSAHISPDTPPLLADFQLQTVGPPQVPSNALGNKGAPPVLQTSGLEGLKSVQQALDSQAYLSKLSGLVSGTSGLNPLLTLGAALSANPLAAAYLGLNLGFQPQLYSTSTITKSSTYVTTDTVYSTRVLRLYDGKRTIFRTLSEPLSTTERTVTTYATETVPYLNTQVLEQQQKQLQQLIAPSLPPQYSTVTSTYTTVTDATSYSTKVYRLVYNAHSTKFRTVTSSSIYATTVTATTTSKIPIQATGYPVLG
ncbi:hypothetical protein GQR58_023397 [Nymphon striatum]|nr:hypothetical protein GQR58_023397 [Nymphon striatum]